MAKLYSKNSIENLNKFEPKPETITYIINFSKALNVKNYGKIQFESILN